ncbi:hypothetical protein B296_00005685 [Ensete ventricosum]|uniref:Uncharacterized protein n=1 Tax=Ensete ventricosum TaxID=4639 RepID=A0A427B684_ENSVE|nr:hypothetical protein B296_00005685 [Ensete ventricosum]
MLGMAGKGGNVTFGTVGTTGIGGTASFGTVGTTGIGGNVGREGTVKVGMVGTASGASAVRPPDAKKPSTAAGLPVLINRRRHPPPSISQLEAFPTSFSSAHRRSPLATQRKRSMGSVTRAALDQKLAVAKRCSHGIIIYASTSLLLNLPFLNLWFLPHLSLEQLAEGAMAGAKAAVIATVAAAVPTVILLFNAILHVIMNEFHYNASLNVNYRWLALGCCHGRGPTSILLLKPS